MWNPFSRKTDPLAERREALSYAREVAALDQAEALLGLERKRAVLMKEHNQRCIDYEMRFNRAYNAGLELDEKRRKGPSNLAVLLEQVKTSRTLVDRNPFAKSALTNISNYVLGRHGMRFRVLDGSKRSISERVSRLWDLWVATAGYVDAQEESLRRAVRDGAVLKRWFYDRKTGALEFRFIEPEQIKSMGYGDQSNPGNRWGLDVDPDDPVTRLAYWVNYDLNDQEPNVKPERVPAEECDWLSWKGTDRNVMRPSPLFFAVVDYLEGAAGVIRNMRELVRVQTAIAIIREHPEGMGGSEIASWQAARAAARPEDPDQNYKKINQEKWTPGTVLDVQNGEKVHFPAAQMQVDRMIAAVQADLRAVAASLGLPEFIFTADASSSNYASLMAAEGPAVKTFEAYQGWLGRYYIKGFTRFLQAAVNGGVRVWDGEKFVRESLPKKVLKMPISVSGPSVRTRDQFTEARTNSIEAKAGVLSPQQWSEQRNRDYEETMRQIEEHNARYPEMQWPPKDPGVEKDEDKTGSERRNAGDAE